MTGSWSRSSSSGRRSIDWRTFFTPARRWTSTQASGRRTGRSTSEGCEASQAFPPPSSPGGCRFLLARDMLDVGGSHGYHSVVLCRRHPSLRSTVLDLPEAVKNAAPLLEMEGMGDRVVHRVGDASTDDFGVETFDLVYTSSLVHHLEDEENRDLAVGSPASGGHYVVVDSVRPPSAKEAGQIGTLGDLFFALTSRAGTWSFEEMADWQRSAGLEPRKPIRLRTGPGMGIQWAVKQATS